MSKHGASGVANCANWTDLIGFKTLDGEYSLTVYSLTGWPYSA